MFKCSFLVFVRFWYENEAVFTAAQRDQLRQANLGKVLCDNGDDIRKAPRDAFLTTSSIEELEECSSLPSISLRPWADCALEEEVEVRTRSTTMMIRIILIISYKGEDQEGGNLEQQQLKKREKKCKRSWRSSEVGERRCGQGRRTLGERYSK